MVKATLQLTQDPQTGKVIVLRGTTFADLYETWRHAEATWDHFSTLYDVPGGASATQQAHLTGLSDYKGLLEHAMWAWPIETVDELKMLAELDTTYEESDHDFPGALGQAVLRILGRPKLSKDVSPSLFSVPAVPRIGLSTGR